MKNKKERQTKAIDNGREILGREGDTDFFLTDDVGFV